ncbi:sensor histidine kinase [Azospirillum agricola]|uniref:sensor histidine kinase n=2 Tax=Azospirillum agricola TaxID=1720247 RepID=UPI000A0EEEEE|nr:ATP-binding protein [Azospirillum agricola]SMH48737.1 Signal transduction histidine kinase [Azospirillum lipoferum]
MRNPVPFRLGVPLAAAIALAVVWVGYFQMADALFESQKRDAIAGAETTARAYESSTGRTLHEIDITLKNFVAKYAEGGLAQARRIVDEGLYDLNLIHHFSVFDRTGAMVFRSAGHGRGEVLDDEAILPFHQGVGRSLMRVGLPYAGSETGRPLLRFTRRIDDADGRFAGVVSANVDPDYLSDFYRQADIGPQGVVSLVGLDHVIRARGVKQGGNDGVGLSISRSGMWAAMSAAPIGVYWQTSLADGQRRAYAYRQVQGYPLVIAVGAALVDMETAVAGLRRHMQAIAALLSLSIVTVAGFLLVQHRNAERLEAALAVNRDFLARVSHELRTPLNAILGFSEVIKDQMLGPQALPRYADYAKDIHASGRHLLTLIDDILDLSRLQAGRMELHLEPVDPVAAVEWAVRIVTPQAEPKLIRMEISRPPAIPPVVADERALKQMLLNLLSNAVKFTPEGGRIHIAIGRGVSGRCVLRITDTGVGMTAEQLRQAVVPFGQASALTTRPGQGTGLGLSIVKSLIEAHGGQMRIDSRPGQGSQITLEFAT